MWAIRPCNSNKDPVKSSGKQKAVLQETATGQMSSKQRWLRLSRWNLEILLVLQKPQWPILVLSSNSFQAVRGVASCRICTNGHIKCLWLSSAVF